MFTFYDIRGSLSDRLPVDLPDCLLSVRECVHVRVPLVAGVISLSKTKQHDCCLRYGYICCPYFGVECKLILNLYPERACEAEKSGWETNGAGTTSHLPHPLTSPPIPRARPQGQIICQGLCTSFKKVIKIISRDLTHTHPKALISIVFGRSIGWFLGACTNILLNKSAVTVYF